MTTKDQPSPVSLGTWAPAFLVALVLTPLVLALEITLGQKSPAPSSSTSTPARPLKPGYEDDGKQKDAFGIRSPGYGRTPN